MTALEAVGEDRRVAGPSPRAILFAVAFAVFVAADDLTVVTTMLRPIITDLGLALTDGLDEAAWVVNAYLIAFVAVNCFSLATTLTTFIAFIALRIAGAGAAAFIAFAMTEGERLRKSARTASRIQSSANTLFLASLEEDTISSRQT